MADEEQDKELPPLDYAHPQLQSKNRRPMAAFCASGAFFLAFIVAALALIKTLTAITEWSDTRLSDDVLVALGMWAVAALCLIVSARWMRFARGDRS